MHICYRNACIHDRHYNLTLPSSETLIQHNGSFLCKQLHPDMSTVNFQPPVTLTQLHIPEYEYEKRLFKENHRGGKHTSDSNNIMLQTYFTKWNLNPFILTVGQGKGSQQTLCYQCIKTYMESHSVLHPLKLNPCTFSKFETQFKMSLF